MTWRPRRVPIRLVAPALVIVAFACGELKSAEIAGPAGEDGGTETPGGETADARAPSDAATTKPTDASSPTDASTPTGCGLELAADAQAPDREWARFRLPAPSPGTASYVTSAETVCDKVTGLTWSRIPSGPKTWDEAVATCDTLSAGGMTDWRLPTRIELLSLVDFAKETPAIDGTAFPGTVVVPPNDAGPPEARYWSASTHPQLFLLRSVVGFDYGQAQWLAKDEKHAVRCVRGGA